MAVRSKTEPPLATNLTDLEKNARLALDTEKLKIELQQLRGELINKQDAREAFVTVIIAAKARFLSLPSTLAPRIAHETDVVVVESLLRESIETVLRELAEHAVSTDL